MPYLSFPMEADGLVIYVSVGLRDQNVKQLRAAGKPIPQRVLLKAILDTGADTSAVNETALASLGLSSLGKILVNTPSGLEIVNRYGVRLTLPEAGSPVLTIPNLEVFSMANPPIGFDMLIGMDVLSECLLVIDGRARQFMLAF